MANPLFPDAGDGADTVQRPIGPWEAEFARYLQPDPGWTYGSVLPLAQNNATGAIRPAVPGFVRDLGQGVLQLLDGPATGGVTPQATMALASLPVASGVAAGADAGGNALASGPIVAYHGSPHDFDAFDMSKIGTGEGAQAYGHGLYFAGNEAVAKGYRDQLSNDLLIGGEGARRVPPGSLEHSIANDMSKYDIGDLSPVYSAYEGIPGARELIDKLAKEAGDDGIGQNPGHMYQVNINADPASLLDWDKPLSEQSPQVQAAIKNAGLAPTEPVLGSFGGVPVKGAPRWADTPEDAEALRQAGIPGIQYLDAGSRAAGDGTRNYVMFDPALIQILRKYGLAAMMAGGGAGAVAGEQTPQQ